MSENIVAKFVQVEQEIVLIDSRVYCREIIEVDHRYWMQDTLYKHQTVIEQYFGILRFETALIGKRGQPEKYALLTEAQCNACLVLSKNLKKTIQAKFQLVADFEQAKQLMKLNFERSLSASVASEDFPPDSIYLDVFPKTMLQVLACTGIQKEQTIVKSIKKYLTPNVDYRMELGGKRGTKHLYFFTQEVYNYLALFHRSKRGLDPSMLETEFNVYVSKFCRLTGQDRKNEIFPHRHEQLNLF